MNLRRLNHVKSPVSKINELLRKYAPQYVAKDKVNELTKTKT